MIRTLAIRILKAGAIVALGPLYSVARRAYPHLRALWRRHAPRVD